MLLIAHRGRTRAAMADNTLSAFADAVAAGVDGIETDVRVTADRQLVLYHDSTAPDGRPVAGLTRAELAAAAGELATLEEAVEAFPSILWNLEVKTRAAADPLRAFLQRRSLPRVLVSSFDRHAAIAAVAGTGAGLGFVIGRRSASLPASLAALATGAPTPPTLVWNLDLLDPATLDRVQRAKLGLALYNVGPAELERVRHWPGLELAIVDDFARIAAP